MNPDDIVKTIIGIQSSLFVLGLFRCMVPLWRLLDCMRRAVKHINGSVTSLGPENLMECDASFERSVILMRCWGSYKQSVRHNAKHLSDPAPFFSFEQVILGPTSRRMAEVLPGVFTGLGILGTFGGLVLGLGGLSVEDATAIKGSIDILLKGMSTAFWTSIVGLVLSLLWSAVDRLSIQGAERALYALHSALRRTACVQTEWDLLGEMANSQQEQLATFKSFASDTLIPQVIEGIREAFDVTLSPHLDKTTQVFERFSNMTADRHIEGIDNITGKILEKVTGLFDGQIESLSETMKDMITWQKSVTKEIEDMSQTLIAAALEQKNSLDAVSRITESLERHAPVFEQFENTLSDIQEGLKKQADGLSHVAQNFIDKSERLQYDLKFHVDTYQELTERREQQLTHSENQLTEMRTFWNEAIQGMNQMREEMISGIQVLGRELTQGLEYTFGQYDQFLSEAVGRLRVVVSSMQEAIQDMPDEIGRIGTGLKALNETVKKVSDEILKAARQAAVASTEKEETSEL